MAERKSVGITPCRPGSWLLHGVMLDVYIIILVITLRVESLCFNIVRMDALASANNHGFVKVITFKFRAADTGHSVKGMSAHLLCTLHLGLTLSLSEPLIR